jgi:hypothetical protein
MAEAEDRDGRLLAPAAFILIAFPQRLALPTFVMPVLDTGIHSAGAAT